MKEQKKKWWFGNHRKRCDTERKREGERRGIEKEKERGKERRFIPIQSVDCCCWIQFVVHVSFGSSYNPIFLFPSFSLYLSFFLSLFLYFSCWVQLQFNCSLLSFHWILMGKRERKKTIERKERNCEEKREGETKKKEKKDWSQWFTVSIHPRIS